jgi:hypothetical protein
MAKQSQIDKAIAQLESEVAILNLAIAKLKAQQQPKATRKARTSTKIAAVKSEQIA